MKVYTERGGITDAVDQHPEVVAIRAQLTALFHHADGDLRHLSHAMVWEVLSAEARVMGGRRRSLRSEDR